MRVVSVVRIAGLIFAAVAAGVIAASTGPEEAGFPEVKITGIGSSVGSEVQSALSDASANELSADSAPQQQVVNGWATKDLLAAIGRELGNLHQDLVDVARIRAEQIAQADLTQVDDRVPVLLAILVGAVAWWGVLGSIGDLVLERRGRRSAPTSIAAPSKSGRPDLPPPFPWDPPGLGAPLPPPTGPTGPVAEPGGRSS